MKKTLIFILILSFFPVASADIGNLVSDIDCGSFLEDWIEIGQINQVCWENYWKGCGIYPPRSESCKARYNSCGRLSSLDEYYFRFYLDCEYGEDFCEDDFFEN